MKIRWHYRYLGPFTFFSSSSAIEGDGFVAITDQQKIPSIVFGDFNNVRNALEHLGSIFDATGALMFNKFIFTLGLCVLPMGVKLRGKLDDHDNKAEEGPLTPTDATARIDIVREPTSLECLKVMDLRKKSKVRWVVDGDENSHFFHGMLNSKLNSIINRTDGVIDKIEGIRRKFFWGGTTDENKIAWIAWDKATSSILNGGLDIGTLKSSNLVVLNGELNDTSLIKFKLGPCYRIAKLKDDLSKIGIDLPSIFKEKVGDGCSTQSDLQLGMKYAYSVEFRAL
ncbi:hypothetical protein Tco_0582997 [Tanacetum coccineum]